MTSTTEYSAYLSERQAEIEYKIIQHVQLDKLIIHNKDIIIEALEKILNTRMTLWIQTATQHPTPSEDFDAVAFFMIQWIRNIYPTLRKELFNIASLYYSRNVELDDDTAANNDLEEDVMTILFRDELRKANNEYLNNLKGSDQKVFWCMLKGLSDENKAAHLFPGAAYTTKIRDKVRYMTNIVEFKYSCLLLTKRIFDRERILQVMNKSNKLVKRYFKQDKLLEIPDDKTLLIVAYAPIETATQTKKDDTWTAVSKSDFNGKIHDHPVVYKNESRGILYDHVSKSVRTIVA